MITPQLDVAVEFLQSWRPGGPWLLCAFHEDGEPQALRAEDADKARDWIRYWQGESYNIYFHVNPCRGAKKAEKTDVETFEWLHVDVDPKKDRDKDEEQKRILAMLEDHDTYGLPKPTALVFSGGGYQAFWRLTVPRPVGGELRAVEELERYNRQIEQLLDADHCHNADRVMRVPGTVNFPNARKRKAGQEPALAAVVRADWDLAYDLEREFVPAVDRQDRGAIGGGLNRPKVELPSGNVARVPPEKLMHVLGKYGITDEDTIGRLIFDGEDTESAGTGHYSRSHWFLRAVGDLVRADVPDELVYAIVTDPLYGISAHPNGQGRGRDRAVRRAIQKAKEELVHPMLAMMNEHHAHVLIGGKSRYLYEYYSEPDGRMELCFLEKQSFMNMHASKHVEFSIKGKNGKTSIEEVPLGAWWNTSTYRREYTEVTFYPGHEFDGVLNLWRGFNVDAVPGSCDLYLQLIKEVICRGDERNYKYLIGWMANAVQRPHQAGQVAVVLRGGQGTGKGTFAKMFGQLFGMHFKHIVNPEHITGKFNSTLVDAALVFADECFVAGDKRQEASLKTLITEERLRTEAKGIDSIDTRNCVKLIMATNSDWAVAAEMDDRRFFVLEVGDSHKQDRDFFTRLREQMRAGGYEALMHYLLTYNLDEFDVWDRPRTDELRLQQERTADHSIVGYFIDALEDGSQAPACFGWQEQVARPVLMDALNEWLPRRMTPRSVNKFLRDTFGVGDARMPGTVQWIDSRGQKKEVNRPRVWSFPSLVECRRLWDEKFGARDWPDEPPQVQDDDQEF